MSRFLQGLGKGLLLGFHGTYEVLDAILSALSAPSCFHPCATHNELSSASLANTSFPVLSRKSTIRKALPFPGKSREI